MHTTNNIERSWETMKLVSFSGRRAVNRRVDDLIIKLHNYVFSFLAVETLGEILAVDQRTEKNMKFDSSNQRYGDSLSNPQRSREGKAPGARPRRSGSSKTGGGPSPRGAVSSGMRTTRTSFTWRTRGRPGWSPSATCRSAPAPLEVCRRPMTVRISVPSRRFSEMRGSGRSSPGGAEPKRT